MDAFYALIRRLNLEKIFWQNLYFSCPREIFFLSEAFLKKYYAMADLPAEYFPRLLAFAGKVNHDFMLRHLAWYCHCLYLRPGEFDKNTFPEEIDLLGEEETGLFYLLVQLTLIPELAMRMERSGYPEKYTLMAASRIGTNISFYRQAHHGLFGLRAVSMPFMLNFLELTMFRIGRFDFSLERLGDNFPYVYRNDRETVIFCGNQWWIDGHGDRVAENTSGASPVALAVTEKTVTGFPIDPHTGKVRKTERCISLDEFHPAAVPGDTALHFHIPGGGGMTPEKCRDSFAEALAFFRRYFPEQKIKVIYSRSWIFNTAWLDYLPQSNLSALIRYGTLFPAVNSGLEGLYFIFGRTDPDFESYPRDNSMRRAMLDVLSEQGRLTASGWFVFPDRKEFESEHC